MQNSIFEARKKLQEFKERYPELNSASAAGHQTPKDSSDPRISPTEDLSAERSEAAPTHLNEPREATAQRSHPYEITISRIKL